MASAAPYHKVGAGGKAPVIVQGYAMDAHPSQAVYQHNTAQEPPRPQSRQSGCRDVFWALLFYVHLAAIIVLTVLYAPVAVQAANQGANRRLEQYNANNNGAQDINVDVSALLPLLGVGGALSVLLASLALGFMIQFADALIKTALIFNVLTFIVSAVASLFVASIGGVVMSSIMAVVAILYTCSVWSRIPFAAANLVTAVTAVRANIGLTFYAFLSIFLLLVWSVLWLVSASSTIFVLGNCDADGVCSNEVSGIAIFLFLVSFYWTIQVITNVVHVTTAGTVGTFWFAPAEANGCCSSAVRNSYVRSLTTSFGSICLGSLIVALIQAVREMVRSMRDNDGGIVACCADCLLGCIESLVEYFNKWAYIYVGLYGFSFMEAGSNVMTLFRNRGWSVIIADLMVDTVLFMVAIGVGALTALFTALIGYLFGSRDGAVIGVAAVFGFIVGYAISSTMFSVVSSAVNTVIVCYAEAPNEFQANHPQLSDRMRTAWRQAYPDEFRY